MESSQQRTEPVSFWEATLYRLKQGFDNDFEWLSALIGTAAFIALFKYKVGVVQLIGACAVAGLTHSLLLNLS